MNDATSLTVLFWIGAAGIIAFNIAYGRLRATALRRSHRWFGCLAAPVMLLLALRHVLLIPWLNWFMLFGASLVSQRIGRKLGARDTEPSPGRWRLAAYAGVIAAIWLLAGGPVHAHQGETAAPGHFRPATHGEKPGFERLDVNEPAAPFTLVNQDGRRFDLKEFKGKAVVMTFMYTSCTDVCPLLVQTLSSVEKHLSDGEKQQVRFIGVTVDPMRDTPQKLKVFLKERGLNEARWQLLTGSAAKMTRVATDYGIVVRPAPAGDLVHNSVFIVIDPAGVERVEFHGATTPVAAIADAVRLALKEPQPRR